MVKIAMITGYLGAGKTTLLNHILGNTEGIRAAVIVNDIGEVNIDADLIAATGAVTEYDDSLIPMTNGCICCSLADDLAKQLQDLANSGDFDYIIIEASGICEPMPIAYTISAFCEAGEDGDAPMALDNIIAVVDCARMFDEFNGGKDLVDEDAEEDDIVNLLIQQIEFCSTLVMNKADQVTPEQMAELKALVRGLQKDAVIIEAVKGDIPLTELLNTGRFSFEGVYDSAVWADALEHPDEHNAKHDEHEAHAHHHHHDHDHDHEHEHDHDHEHEHGPGCTCGHCHDHEEGHDHVAEYGITTFVYERRCPFDIDKLGDLVSNWPSCVIRCKGLLWCTTDNDMCFVFEQAGHRFYMSENGLWVAAATPEEQEQVRREAPEVFDDWDPQIGDRRTKLVFIGRDMVRADIEAQLDACLV